ncbi:hydrolase [Bacillus massilinigeriensis]|uniref:hydrolase n=1 Tax=Bacillus mediterraneensis TaxID=1805474 RepID=UPI0008F8C0E1|nr:hydrolase [Bacillus mediterraneensis]
METRNFKLDTEWCVVHYPDRPNGFGVLLIGDERHFVDSESSFWTQNEGKRIFLQKVREKGYTVFTSNFYGKNWGSDASVNMARELYTYIMRTEIMNDKIHILAEGMGALAALKLIHEGKINVRSLLLINPILSLTQHLELEKEHKFFHKKLLKELRKAYGMPDSTFDNSILNEEVTLQDVSVPVKIIHVLSGNRAYRQSMLLREYDAMWRKEKLPVSIIYMLPEKKPQLPYQAIRFWKNKEQIL